MKRVLIIALIGNIASAIIKLVFGLLSNSVALLGDAFHSVFDSLSSIIGYYGIKISAQPPDLDHPYGHSKFEQIAAMGIVIMMFVACFNIVREAIDRIIAGVIPNITLLSFVSISTSLSISLIISIYERKIGKSTSSMILLADSSHTLTDVFASLVVIAGFVGTSIGFSYADSIAATVVCLLIAYIGFLIFREASNVLVDRGISLDTLQKVKRTVNGLGEKVACSIDCHSVRGKVLGEKIYLDMHVTLTGDMSVEESHRITEYIEAILKQAIKGIEEVIVHVEPHEN